MKISTTLIVLPVLAACLCVPPAHAGTVITQESAVMHTDSPSPFTKGAMEFEALGGAFWSVDKQSMERPEIDHWLATLRLGWMLTDVRGSNWSRGNWEFLLEGFYGQIFEGPGDYVTGGTALLRYNFVQPDSKWIPYFQIGAGGVYSDIHRDPVQKIIGREWEFNLQASLGVRYMLSETWALTFEGGYRHVSNADTADRNLGLNSLGGQIGFSVFY